MSNSIYTSKALGALAIELRVNNTIESHRSAQVLDLIRKGHNGVITKNSPLARKLFATMPRGNIYATKQ